MLSAHLRLEIVESLANVFGKIIKSITHVLTQIVYTLAYDVRDQEDASNVKSD